MIFRRCTVLLGNQADAEDALQEVFIRALNSADSFRGESSPMTWLYRICTNHCLNVLRSRSRRHNRETGGKQAAGDRLQQATNIEDIATIREILPSFDASLRRLAILYFVDGMSQEEAAAETGLSVPTVRKRLLKFIAKAKKMINRGDR